MKTILLTLLIACVQPGCSYRSLPSDNRGTPIPVRTENRGVAGFKKLYIANNFAAEITVGGDFNVSVEGEDRFLELLTTKVADDTLTVSLQQKFSSDLKLPVKISMPALTELEVAGRSSAVVTGERGDSIKLTANGATSIKISGEVKALRAHGYGASRIDAEQLKTVSADVEAVGVANMIVSPSATLKARTAGNSSVVYTGNPKVENSSSDTSKVTKKE